MDLSKLKETLAQNAALQSAVSSAQGQKLAGKIDGNALEQAVKSGDTAQMKTILSQILSSPEGKALAQQVQQAVKQK